MTEEQSSLDKDVSRVNYVAVAVTTIIAFVFSALWYGPLFGKQYVELSGPLQYDNTSIGVILAELARTFVLIYVLARIVMLLGVVDWKGAVRLGAWLWIGFPAMILLGSVLHQNVPWMLAAIHAGDLLVKVLLAAVIVGGWPRSWPGTRSGRVSATSVLSPEGTGRVKEEVYSKHAEQAIYRNPTEKPE